MPQLILIVAMFALLWLFLIRPQRARAQAHRELVTKVSVGDEILTVGGLYGDVIEIDDDDLLLEIAPGTQVRIARRAVAAVVPPDAEDEEEEARRRKKRRPLSRRANLCYVTRKSAANLPRCFREPKTAPHPRRTHRRRTHRRRAACHSRISDRAVADPRARSPGRPRGDVEGRAAAQPAAAEDRSRPLGRDPAQPRRPARRRGARDPQAGQRPDRDRLAGPQEPGAGDRDSGEDRSARALRPRVQPRPPVGQRAGLPDRKGLAVLAPRRSAGSRGREQQDDVVPVRRQAEAAQRPRRLQGQAAAEQGGRGGGCEGHAPEGVEDLRGAAEDGRPFVRRRRGRLPRRRRGQPDQEFLLSDPLRPHERRREQGGARDERRRSQALGHARGLRHDHR